MEIGIFIKSGEEFRGTIQTLTLSAELIFSPVLVSNGKYKVLYNVFANGCQIGAAWPKTAGSISEFKVQFDDPTFPAPVQAHLVEREIGVFVLTWKRPSWRI
ncbi:DUF736 domain-containing protein [Acidocella sp.]|uniref:DUF736 domain-containing protein n=1 Tax=Acidocella sp. TaxID=50710 RepID=UPI00185EE322|nr:DUF736 domain-containing protein [Acidocella sp.]